MLSAQSDQACGEVEHVLVDVLPVEPGQLRVVAVGIVVAVLGPTQLIAAEQHGHALAEQQRRQQVAPLAGAQGEDRGVVGGALDAAVPGAVPGLAVTIAVAVGTVVLVVVADQVEQGEAVVGGDEVDARGRGTSLVGIEVGASR